MDFDGWRRSLCASDFLRGEQQPPCRDRSNPARHLVSVTIWSLTLPAQSIDKRTVPELEVQERPDTQGIVFESALVPFDQTADGLGVEIAPRPAGLLGQQII